MSAAAAPRPAHALSPDEVQRFHRDGYLTPFTRMPVAEMEAVRAELDRSTLDTVGISGSRHQSRHLDSRLVYDLCAHPTVVDRVASLLGPDVVLWRSNFFDKPHGAKSIPWHQDFNFWPLDPIVNVSAWLAITPCVIANSCVHVIPGSHRKILRHGPVDTSLEDFDEKADETAFDASKKVPIELQPGQFFLFNERLLHGSAVNQGERRCGLAIRMTTPAVRVFSEELFPEHGCLLIAGEDRFAKNRMLLPPGA
jgi:Phytanoyl-CoA dioxygenase (PhyH)